MRKAVRTPITEIVNDEGTPFIVRYCPKGARYGLTGVYRHERAVVEFYDPTTADDSYDRTEGNGRLGYLISSYYVDTMRESRGGIRLDSQPSYSVSAANVAAVLAWADVCADVT